MRYLLSLSAILASLMISVLSMPVRNHRSSYYNTQPRTQRRPVQDDLSSDDSTLPHNPRWVPPSQRQRRPAPPRTHPRPAPVSDDSDDGTLPHHASWRPPARGRPKSPSEDSRSDSPSPPPSPRRRPASPLRQEPSSDDDSESESPSPPRRPAPPQREEPAAGRAGGSARTEHEPPRPAAKKSEPVLSEFEWMNLRGDLRAQARQKTSGSQQEEAEKAASASRPAPVDKEADRWAAREALRKQNAAGAQKGTEPGPAVDKKKAAGGQQGTEPVPAVNKEADRWAAREALRKQNAAGAQQGTTEKVNPVSQPAPVNKETDRWAAREALRKQNAVGAQQGTTEPGASTPKPEKKETPPKKAEDSSSQSRWDHRAELRRLAKERAERGG